MKVYLTPPQPSRGLERIATALRVHAPQSVKVYTFPRNMDLTVLYAIGRCEQLTNLARDILRKGQKYAVVQCCLRSTQKPHTSHWRGLWEGATCVWSYYDLTAAIMADGGDWGIPNFYHAPLGADASVFYPRDLGVSNRWWQIATSGLSRLSESVRECHLAAQIVASEALEPRYGCHIGSKVRGVEFYVSISDSQLAEVYSDAYFVSGLRRIEGFELPAAEGLLCGARPVLFDTPDYRHWYEPFGEFIHEGTRQEVVDQLVELFRRGARPVTEDEIQQARERFNWKTIVDGFYERVI